MLPAAAALSALAALLPSLPLSDGRRPCGQRLSRIDGRGLPAAGWLPHSARALWSRPCTSSPTLVAGTMAELCLHSGPRCHLTLRAQGATACSPYPFLPRTHPAPCQPCLAPRPFPPPPPARLPPQGPCACSQERPYLQPCTSDVSGRPLTVTVKKEPRPQPQTPKVLLCVFPCLSYHC